MYAMCCPVDISGFSEDAQRRIQPPLPTDVRGGCDACARLIWVSPSKRLLREAGLAKLVCYICVLEMIETTKVLDALDRPEE